MCCCIQWIVNKVNQKLAMSMQDVFKVLLFPLVLLASAEAMVLVYFGVRADCVKKADSEGHTDEEVGESEASLLRLKREANCRWYFAIVCMFLTTLSSVCIGAALLQTNFRSASGEVAKHDLILIVVIGALRTLISGLVIGGLLFGTNPEGFRGVYCATCFFAPITLVLPAISGMLFVKSLNPFRGVDVNIANESFGTSNVEAKCEASKPEQQSLLEAETKVGPHASDSAV